MDQKTSAAHAALAAFPAADAGQKRWVIFLKACENRADEANCLVQLHAGMSVKGDGINRSALSGSLQLHTLAGWGYGLVRYEGDTRISSTRVGYKGVAEHDTWVYTKPLLYAYNSQLPVVVYTPSTLQIRHGLFRLSASAGFAQEG